MKLKKIKSVDARIKKLKRAQLKEKKNHPIKYYSEQLYYRIINFLQMVPLNIKTFIQRGKRGFGDSDVWSLDYYLSDVIEHSVKCLKKNFNSRPADLTEGQWVDILNSVSYTFFLVKECSEGNLVLIRDKKEREKHDKFCDKFNNNSCRLITPKEIKDYDLGWKNFRLYFHNLWD